MSLNRDYETVNFEIIITPDAENDLTELRDYIAYVLNVPEVALIYLEKLYNEFEKLKYMASSIAPVQDEPWRTYGIRKIIVKNFYVYFRVDESARRVYILNVIYAKRNQLIALNKMKND